jgi:hypothetical protein
VYVAELASVANPGMLYVAPAVTIIDTLAAARPSQPAAS